VDEELKADDGDADNDFGAQHQQLLSRATVAVAGFDVLRPLFAAGRRLSVDDETRIALA